MFFAAGDYLISPKIYNEFSPGNTGNGSFTIRAGVEFNAISLPFMIEADYANWQYPHNCGTSQSQSTPANSPECWVTSIGSRFATYVPAFTATNRHVDVRAGIRVFNPHVYVAIGYIWGSTNYGYPQFTAVGGGLEKLPDYGHSFTYYGSIYYYPNFSGNYHNAAINTGPTSFGIGYNLLRYQAGIAWAPIPAVYIDLGWKGENGANKNNAPISFSFNGPYAGLMFMFPW